MSKSINEIMYSFNFEKVHECMVVVDWKWGITEAVPTVDELEAMAQRLLIDALNSDRKYTVIECGGFRAVKDEDGLGLSFVLEEA